MALVSLQLDNALVHLADERLAVAEREAALADNISKLSDVSPGKLDFKTAGRVFEVYAVRADVVYDLGAIYGHGHTATVGCN